LATTDPADSDQALLLRVINRNEEALGALYDRHGRAAFSLAYRLVGNPEIAEEVVQEAFLSIWRHAESYRPERGAVRAWLLTVVRNRAIDAIRARDGRLRAGGAPMPRTVPLDDLILMAADDPEDTAVRWIDGEMVRKALAELPPEQRRVVDLAYFGGLSYPEIAARLSAPVGTVKSRMRLALERLRALLNAGR
jgi:RNA polymerase sigma-70 factor (ECF subfamily)